jgi:hypothetical protein
MSELAWISIHGSDGYSLTFGCLLAAFSLGLLLGNWRS